MEKRETKEEIIPKYVDIKETRCGKCKQLKIIDRQDALCLVHGVLPRILPHFFGDACKDFEEL